LNQITGSEDFLNQDKIDLSTQENSLVGVDSAVAATNLAQSHNGVPGRSAGYCPDIGIAVVAGFFEIGAEVVK